MLFLVYGYLLASSSFAEVDVARQVRSNLFVERVTCDLFGQVPLLVVEEFDKSNEDKSSGHM